MKSTLISLCALLLSLQAPAISAQENDVQIVPAVTMTKADAERLKSVNKLLHERQQVVDKIMAKEGLKRLNPQLPNYHLMSANSVQALLNQLDYTALAQKIGAPMPERPDFETGQALKNNRFLHYYNNAILRSIAKKLDVKTPEPVAVGNDGLEEQCFNLVKQNSEIVGAIAEKLGV